MVSVKVKVSFLGIEALTGPGKIFQHIRLNFNTHWMGYSACFGDERALGWLGVGGGTSLDYV